MKKLTHIIHLTVIYLYSNKVLRYTLKTPLLSSFRYLLIDLKSSKIDVSD